MKARGRVHELESAQHSRPMFVTVAVLRSGHLLPHCGLVGTEAAHPGTVACSVKTYAKPCAARSCSAIDSSCSAASMGTQ